ncbi:hypothetical protein KR222_000663, partial [Zaprionus bogoriensis]
TFEECYDTKCEDLQCAYGACYNQTKRCDGKKDCWDGTDEYKFDCDDNAIDAYERTIIGDHETYTQYQCQDSKECLSYSQLCNGVEECIDKSDESEEFCVGTLCPTGSFRCGYGACIAETAVCDHALDCRDGSDELASMCKKKNAISHGKEWHISHGEIPTPPPKDKTDATTPKPISLQKSCYINFDRPNLRAKTLYNGLPLMKNATVEHRTTIRLSCSREYVLTGYDTNTCNDGKWINQGQSDCVKFCPVESVTKPSADTICAYNSKPIDCKTTKLIEGTIAEMKCAAAYKAASVTRVQRVCRKGVWKKLNPNIRQRLKCIPDCGKTFNTVQGYPWLVSIYLHTADLNYENRCLATIVDPSFVVTAASCFSESAEASSYLVVLGNHTESFSLKKEHGFEIQHIAAIEANK